MKYMFLSKNCARAGGSDCDCYAERGCDTITSSMSNKLSRIVNHPIFRVILSYVFIFITVALFVWLKLTVLEGLSRETPYLFILFSVFISAFYGGFGPGVAATLSSIIAIFYYFLPPYNQFELLYTEDFEIIITYIMVGFAFSWLLDQQRQIKTVLEAVVKKRTEQLQLTNEELQRSNQELQDFAYIASHDLQEPLRKILAFGDRLEAKYGAELSDEALNYLKRMQSSAKRMKQLVESLLMFARVANTDIPIKKVSLNAVVSGVISDMEIRIEEQRAEIIVENLPEIEGNPTQLSQVFQNLISNSLKFKHRQREPIVEISSEVVEVTNNNGDNLRKYCKISITDNGIGIPPEYQEKIFNIFQRLHGRSKYEGTGIGLAVVRRIVERHDGKISVSSIEGEGTSFEIMLPLTQIRKK